MHIWNDHHITRVTSLKLTVAAALMLLTPCLLHADVLTEYEFESNLNDTGAAGRMRKSHCDQRAAAVYRQELSGRGCVWASSAATRSTCRRNHADLNVAFGP